MSLRIKIRESCLKLHTVLAQTLELENTVTRFLFSLGKQECHTQVKRDEVKDAIGDIHDFSVSLAWWWSNGTVRRD